MDVFEFAIRMERDGETYYRRLAAATPIRGFSAICGMLAGQEVRHRRLLGAMRKEHGKPMPSSRLTSGVKSVFARLLRQRRQPSLDAAQVKLYEHALELERQSRKFYEDRAGSEKKPAVRVVFRRLAEEENKHQQILESMLEFVSRPLPGHWLENAEWNHRDEY